MLVTFEEYNKKEKETKEYKNKILKLIDEFINTDMEFIKNHTIRQPYNGSVDFYFDGLKDNLFCVIYRVNWSSDELYFTRKEYNRLLDFMKNPELYKNSKKYNL